MSLRERLSQVRAKSDARRIASHIIDGVLSMEDLMVLFFSDDLRLCQKASWPLTMIADQQPDLILPYMQRLIDNLDRPHHDAVIRNTVRTWQSMDIPEEFEGNIYDRCFEFLADPQYAIAIRVFSMTVCTNIAVRHPSLAHEIIPVIEDHWDHSTAAWRGRGKKELKRLNSVLN